MCVEVCMFVCLPACVPRYSVCVRPGGSMEELMSDQVVKASAESILLRAID